MEWNPYRINPNRCFRLLFHGLQRYCLRRGSHRSPICWWFVHLWYKCPKHCSCTWGRLHCSFCGRRWWWWYYTTWEHSLFLRMGWEPKWNTPWRNSGLHPSEPNTVEQCANFHIIQWFLLLQPPTRRFTLRWNNRSHRHHHPPTFGSHQQRWLFHYKFINPDTKPSLRCNSCNAWRTSDFNWINYWWSRSRNTRTTPGHQSLIFLHIASLGISSYSIWWYLFLYFHYPRKYPNKHICCFDWSDLSRNHLL